MSDNLDEADIGRLIDAAMSSEPSHFPELGVGWASSNSEMDDTDCDPDFMPSDNSMSESDVENDICMASNVNDSDGDIDDSVNIENSVNIDDSVNVDDGVNM